MSKKAVNDKVVNPSISPFSKGRLSGIIVGRFVVALMYLASGILYLASDLHAFGGGNEGTKGAQFLKLPVGARYIAMGEAATAIADDANAIYYNVAGLARLEKKSAEYMYAGFMLKDKISGDKDPGQHWIAYAMPISETIGSAGIGLQFYSPGDFTKTDAAASPKGTLSPSDLAVNLSYARKVAEIPLGATIKIISSKIENTATAFALDLGAQYTKLMEEKLLLGAALQNFGSDLKYEVAKTPLPLRLNLGAGYKVRDNWVAALDLILPSDSSPVFALGTDYKHTISEDMSISGRLGLNTRTIKVDGFSLLSFGAGFNFRMVSLDLAWTPMGDLGQTIRFSLGVKF